MPAVDFATSNAPFAVSCAVDAAIVLAALWSRRPAALAAAVAALAAKGLAMLALGLDPFGVAHVLWLDLVIVVPLAGALLLLQRRRRAPAILALVAAPFGAYASLVEPDRLVTERATVDVPGSRDVRIGVVADLQFERVGDHERDAVERVMRERPDVIVLPGDLHQGSEASLRRELPAIHALLRRLRAPGGVYAVQGDAESLPELRRVVAGTGVRMLVDESAITRGLVITGVRRDGDTAAAARAVAAAPRDGVGILLAHRPDAARRLDRDVDLVIAGHTHGGQLQLPLLGPPFTASEVPRDVAAGGLHMLEGRPIYVSRGIGVERRQAPRLRFLAPPEVSVLTLR